MAFAFFQSAVVVITFRLYCYVQVREHVQSALKEPLFQTALFQRRDNLVCAGALIHTGHDVRSAFLFPPPHLYSTPTHFFFIFCFFFLFVCYRIIESLPQCCLNLNRRRRQSYAYTRHGCCANGKHQTTR